MSQEQSMFKRLTRLFSSGPAIRRKVKNYDGNQSISTAVSIFHRARNDIYNSVLSSYGTFSRMSRYSDFAEMEATPEIASALDIYSEESVAQDERGISLHIYSENRKIKELLDTLFYDTLNINFNLPMWVRNLVKYGDFFLFLDINEQYGIINTFPISISEIEREEGYDPENISAARFRWITQGNTVLENWQVAHFRLLGNDSFLPYGTSVLDSARRIWRQLILMEDAMLVYRVIRSPERRVFYIDVGSVPPENIGDYMNQAKDSLKRQPIIDRKDGRVDLRYNPYSVDEDYFIPVRGGESGTRIETLAGGQNTTAIEDVQYIQKKLFAALKIPKAYLSYDEDIGSKATLAQEDIRFSRTIQRIQQTVISELNKIAMIHLYTHGFEGESLINFELKLSNPSSIAQQQKLELISSRFSIAGQAPEGIVDRNWVRKNVMNLTDFEIELIEEGRDKDKIRDLEIESIQINSDEDVDEFDNEFGMFDSSGQDDFGSDSIDTTAPATDEEIGEEIFDSDNKNDLSLITDSDEQDEDEFLYQEYDSNSNPIKTNNQPKNVFGGKLKQNRNKVGGPLKSHMPNLKSIVGIGSKTRKQDSSNKPYDQDFVLSTFQERLTDNKVSLLNQMPNKKSLKVLLEDRDYDDDELLDLNIESE
jgi:hypothetical protein